MVTLIKHKRVRLTGKASVKLNYDIHERDDYTCIIKGCGRHVALGEKFHHEPCGAYKEDRIERGCSAMKTTSSEKAIIALR